MQKACESCGRSYEAKRAASKFCSDRCRKRKQRAPLSVVKDETPAAEPVEDYSEGPLVTATRRQVEAAGREDTALGLAAILAAKRLEKAGVAETGAGFKALVDTHRAALAEAIKDGKGAADPLDQIRAAAALKLVGGAS